MKRARFRPLVWPVALLLAGAAAGGLAEFAVGQWQAYQVYGLARPVADLLLVIGGTWLVVAVIGTIRNR